MTTVGKWKIMSWKVYTAEGSEKLITYTEQKTDL
jgi:hypothetical protein